MPSEVDAVSWKITSKLERDAKVFQAGFFVLLLSGVASFTSDCWRKLGVVTIEVRNLSFEVCF